MLNRYPLWKYLLILVVLVAGLIYSLPNLFPADPAIQVSDAQGNALDERQITRVEEALSERDIACLLYTSPSPRDLSTSRMPSSA